MLARFEASRLGSTVEAVECRSVSDRLCHSCDQDNSARFEASRLGSTVEAVECRSVSDRLCHSCDQDNSAVQWSMSAGFQVSNEVHIDNREHARIGALTTSANSLKFSPLHSAGKLTQLILFPVNDVSTCKSSFPSPKPAWAP